VLPESQLSITIKHSRFESDCDPATPTKHYSLAQKNTLNFPSHQTGISLIL